MKKYGNILWVTSVVILLPLVVGLILWNRLPSYIPIHWNAAGQIDDYSKKRFVVFGIPALLLGVQWLCALGVSLDPKKYKHPKKIVHIIFWIIPMVSCLISAVIYAVALGKEVKMEVVLPIFAGLVLAIVGNYLPKCKQNYTIGIKIPWTLNSEENWNKTHRFAGWIWLLGGLVIILTGFVGGFWIFIGAVAVMVLAPVIYSFVLHRKGI